MGWGEPWFVHCKMDSCLTGLCLLGASNIAVVVKTSSDVAEDLLRAREEAGPGLELLLLCSLWQHIQNCCFFFSCFLGWHQTRKCLLVYLRIHLVYMWLHNMHPPHLPIHTDKWRKGDRKKDAFLFGVELFSCKTSLL